MQLRLNMNADPPPSFPQVNVPSNRTVKIPQSKKMVLSQHKIVPKKTNKSILETMFKSLDHIICTSMDLPLHSSNDPTHILDGKFSPVDELPPTACHVVEGSLPSCLDGYYIRIGPNPQFTPRGPYHLFDGDGMIHSIKISQGKATLCSRYVETYKYMVESEMGYSFFPSIFSSFNGVAASAARCMLTLARVLCGQINPVAHGFGTANTSLSIIGGRLFALCESDLPYEIELTSEGDIITLGRHDFYSREPFWRMTAHPKIDPDTGEAFAFMYDFKPPFLKYFRINQHGEKQPEVPIFSMKSISVIHDFAITKNYAILPDIQAGLGPMQILKGRSPVKVHHVKVPRLGFIPRYAVDEKEMWWIDVPGFNMMHSFNAWEEDGGDTIVMVASNILSVEECLEKMEMRHLSLEKIIINVKERSVRRIPLHAQDFGAINPAFHGKKIRYTYAAALIESEFGGVVKIDLSLADVGDSTVARNICGRGYYCGEPYFVAREPYNKTDHMDEDDGYLLTLVYDENVNESKFLVMDAKSPDLQIVATVKLPTRVPCGFHGLFVPQSYLTKL